MTNLDLQEYLEKESKKVNEDNKLILTLLKELKSEIWDLKREAYLLNKNLK